MIYKINTTGTVSEVVLHDMGARTITHPTVNLDLGLEYTDDELIDSNDLVDAITNGWLTITEKSGALATEEYVDSEISTISGSLSSMISTSTALATLQLSRTSTTYAVQTSWTEITFDETSYENEPDIIEHDDVNTDRILIKADGTYSFTYGTVVEAQSTTTSTYARLYKNNTTEVPASDSQIRSYNGERHELSGSVTRDLLAGDYIVLQLYRSSDGPVNVVDASFNAIKLDGVKGEKGDAGEPGDTGASGLITISGSAYFDAYDSSGGLTLTTSWQDVPFDVVRKNSGEFSLTSDTELTIPFTSTYHLTVRVSTNITSGTNRSDSKIRLVKDTGSGYIEVPGSIAFIYNRMLDKGTGTANITILDDFADGDKIKVQVARDSGSDTIETLANGSSLSLHIPGGMPGKDGADGLPGTGATVNLQDEGTIIPNAPHSTLNFTGAGVNVTDGGSGVATINVPGGIIIQDESTNITNTPHTTINFTGDNVSAYDLGGGVAGVWVQPTTFGTWYGWSGDETETSTNSTSPIQKARLSLTGITAGNYRIGWYYEWRRNSTSNDYMARVQIDDTTTIMEHSEESQDTNSWHCVSGFYIGAFTTGNHYIDFDHYGESTSNTSYTRRLRIEIWRVS